MKTFMAGLVLCVSAVSSFAQTPDPRDSVILESKTVWPQIGPSADQPVMRVRMWITNKDSLTAVTIVFAESTTVGNAFATLGRSNNGTGGRTHSSVITVLPHPKDGLIRLGEPTPVLVTGYNSPSPFRFKVGGFFVPGDDLTKEPPNSTRRALLEIKFDSITGSGQFQLDTTVVLGVSKTRFSRVPAGQAVNVHSVKAVITVSAFQRGDLDEDGFLTGSDVVMMLNCLFLDERPPGGIEACDVTCDGGPGVGDVVILMYMVFLGLPPTC